MRSLNWYAALFAATALSSVAFPLQKALACIVNVTGASGTVVSAGTIDCVAITNATVNGNVVTSGTISPGGIIVTNSQINGAIQDSAAVAAGIFVDTTSVINAGALAGIGVSGAPIFVGGIHNSGTIAGSLQVSGVTTFSGGIANTGSITQRIVANTVGSFTGGISNTGSAQGIDVIGASAPGASSFSGGINNSGQLAGGVSGISVLSVNFAGGITNSGTISASGIGLNLQQTASFLAPPVATFTGGISNTGIITGSTGIYFQFQQPVMITNSGTITGTSGTAIQFASTVPASLIVTPTSVINGNVVTLSGGTLQLGGSVGIGTFNAALIGPTTQYEGFTSFAKVDVSTWSLTGTNGLALPWTVQQGTLNVTGALGNSSFSVTGGTLAGNGTLGSLTVTGGTVSPGAGIATLPVNGNVSFTTGATYQVDANAAGQSDRITAAGQTTLTGGTVQVPTLDAFAPTTTYTILSSTAGLAGTFAGATTASPLLVPSLRYDANNAYLTITRILFANMAATNNQRAVGSALDRVSVGLPLLVAVSTLRGASAQNALTALSGEIHADVSTVLLDDARYVRLAMLGRMEQSAFSGQSALGYGGPSVANASDRDGLRPSNVTWWFQGVGAHSQIGSDGNAGGISSTLGGFVTGVDSRVGDHWRAGLVGGYTDSSVRANSVLSTADITTGHVGAYASASYDLWNFRSGAVYSWSDVHANRLIQFTGFSSTAAAQYNAGTGQVFGEVGRELTSGPLAVEPYVGITYERARTGDFTESGGGIAALQGRRAVNNAVLSDIGVHLARTFDLQNSDMKVVPHLSLAWQHTLDSVSPDISMIFQNTGSDFAIAGVTLPRNAAMVDAGIDLKLNARMKIGISYAGLLSDRIHDHSLQGNFIWRF